ncbi:Ig-like domain-containing protein [Patescibacteria group bacterium]|nr:Ig-like domain-containing protein [Patescibacteria group bacterium]
MKALHIGAIFIFLALIAVAVPDLVVHAQSQEALEVAQTAGLGTGRSLPQIIGTIINVFLGFLGVIFLILVIYSGFLWMTAGGDDEKVNRAKQTLIRGAIGLAIVLSAFAITSFIMNALLGATGINSGSGPGGTVAIERFSGALGSGPLRDHYPLRNQTDVARNTNIVVTFKDAINPADVILGYDTNGTPTDASDDVVATAINAENVRIYRTIDGEEGAIANVSVALTEDFKTFVFNPAEYLGSATEDVSYSVFLSPDIQNLAGQDVFVGGNNSGYLWSFETGTFIDVTAPTIKSVVPMSGATYDRNIAIQVTFSEAVDPTAASGIREAASGFSNILTSGGSGILSGTYTLSNGYKTVTFLTDDVCGTNSCGETIYCLPGSQAISVDVKAATPGATPPQVDTFPYNGIADMAANSLDGNDDGVAGDGYVWGFSTTNDINLTGPAIESINPNILAEDVPLDQPITAVFNDVLLANSISSDDIFLTNIEVSGGMSHEQWYRFDVDFLAADGSELSPGVVPQKSEVTIAHGTFLESVNGLSYRYGVEFTEGVRNAYQNCYVPANGPTATGAACGVTSAAPYCCNGSASAVACDLF